MKVVNNTKKYGLSNTYAKIKRKLALTVQRHRYFDYFNTCYDIKQDTKNTKFEKNVKFSIIVPLFNTPYNYLIEMIDSVVNQTYTNWELLLIDASDDEHKYVKKYCRNKEIEDARIIYIKIKENLGISKNSNKGFELAKGDYFGLLDHDDILHSSALYKCAKSIGESDVDLIYTDEITFQSSPDKGYSPNIKPDYSPNTLRSYNYICHFTVFKRKFYDKGVSFDNTLDGSQDYDLILRITEKAENIIHIPEILYFWRAHKNSVAMNIKAKPYTMQAGKKALEQHLIRKGLNGKVEDSDVLTTYHIMYEIKETTLISVIVKETSKKINIKGYDNIEFVDKPEKAKGKYLIFMEEVVKVNENWFTELLMLAERNNIGIVGSMVLLENGRVVNTGYSVNKSGMVYNLHSGYLSSEHGYMSRISIVQDVTAVSSAGMIIKNELYKKIDGFNNELVGKYRDADLCLKVRKLGYDVVVTPYSRVTIKEISKDEELENRRTFFSIWREKLTEDKYFSKYIIENGLM